MVASLPSFSGSLRLPSFSRGLRPLVSSQPAAASSIVGPLGTHCDTPYYIYTKGWSLDGFYEEDYLVALFLAELSESEHRLVGIALAAFGGATVPHNGLDDVAGAAVVEALRSRTAFAGQSAAPEGSGAAPARADVVLHKQSVLHHVRVGPNLLIGIARHVGVGEEAVGVLDIVAARGPRGTVASGATHFGEQAFAFLP